MINQCINIENFIKDIKLINENIKKFNPNNNKSLISFSPVGESLNEFLKTIKSFGDIYYNTYRFKKCPLNIDEKSKYIVIGEKENIITKIGKNNKIGVICENELKNSVEFKWKIKILNTLEY